MVIVDANQTIDQVKEDFKDIRELINKNAKALIEPKTNLKIPDTGKSIKDIQHPNCKLGTDVTTITV